MVFRGHDLWRRAPIFKWKFTDAVPGIREGSALFAVYLAVDWVSNSMGAGKEAHHGDAHHGDSHGAVAASATSTTDHHGKVATPAHH